MFKKFVQLSAMAAAAEARADYYEDVNSASDHWAAERAAQSKGRGF